MIDNTRYVKCLLITTLVSIAFTYTLASATSAPSLNSVEKVRSQKAVPVQVGKINWRNDRFNAPLLGLVAALKTHPSTRLFQVKWSYEEGAGVITPYTAIYDRKKETIKYYSKHENFLLTDVTEHIVRQAAKDYADNMAGTGDGIFPVFDIKYGCTKQPLPL